MAQVRRLPQAIAALGLAGGLTSAVAGCSGTPFGDQLARSFSPPPASPAPSAPVAVPAASTAARPPAPGGAPAAPAPQAGQTRPDQTRPNQTSPSQTRPGQAGAPAPSRPTPTPAAPAPYRITLRLPGADPSAPAEAVTEALRAAGLSFEVEMIERVPTAPAAPR